jgi:hypothetical protein
MFVLYGLVSKLQQSKRGARAGRVQDEPYRTSRSANQLLNSTALAWVGDVEGQQLNHSKV